MEKKIEFLSFEDFCLERDLKDRVEWEIAVGMYLAGVASETFYPCEPVKAHPTIQ